MTKTELAVLDFKCATLASYLARLSDDQCTVFGHCFPPHHPVTPDNIDQALDLCDRTFRRVEMKFKEWAEAEKPCKRCDRSFRGPTCACEGVT